LVRSPAANVIWVSVVFVAVSACPTVKAVSAIRQIRTFGGGGEDEREGMTPTCSKMPRSEGSSHLGHSSPSPGNMHPHRSTSAELNVNSMSGALGIGESVPAAKSNHCHNRASYGGSTVLCLYRFSALDCKLEDEYWRNIPHRP
jgi:hypothetical protein